MASSRPLYIPDNYTLVLIGTVVLATVLPASGWAATGLQWLTTAAIAALFFLHGAKLSREAIVAGFTHWRLHAMVFACTFVLFPVLGLVLGPVARPLLGETLYLGLLYLCFLPSTVQSAIALTSMARGNVSAAVCAASGSTLLGVFITPFLVGMWVAPAEGEVAILDSVLRIIVQLLVPFVVGHMLRPWVGPLMMKARGLVLAVDRGSILLVVYTAFSAAVLQGLWQQVSVAAVLWLCVISLVLLAVVLWAAGVLGRRAGFGRADIVTMRMAAAQKSMATGVPMAQVLFGASTVGLMVLPLMIYHQLQLMACAILAQRWGRQTDAEQAAAEAARVEAAIQAAEARAQDSESRS